MSDPPIKPTVKIGGSAFMGNTTQTNRPIPHLIDKDKLAIVSLVDWCDNNFISRDIGYKLIKLGYLIGFRRHGSWWVAANPNCIEQLLEYLGMDKLLFDADNS